MPELPFLGHIRELHVIRDDVALQTHGERLTKICFRIEEQRIPCGVDESIARDTALCVGHAGVERFVGLHAAHVIRNLAVQITHAIRAREAELRT